MSKLFEVIDGKVIVTTSTGARVECKPYADDLMRAGTALTLPDKPDAPRYLLGEPEEGEERQIYVPYTETSITDPATPPEDLAAWEEYVPLLLAYGLEVQAIEEKKALMRARVLINKATRVIDQPDLREWAKKQEEFYGIPMPEDNETLLIQYFTTEVSKGKEDALLLMAGVMRATGATEEVLDEFEDIFRDKMGIGAGADAEADPEDAPAATEGGTEGLVDGATVESA